jgi:hypothetical protein
MNASDSDRGLALAGEAGRKADAPVPGGVIGGGAGEGDVAGVETTPQDDERLDDPAGVVGMLAGIAVLATLLFGVLIPVIFWILSGVLGLFVLGCALFSTSRLKWWRLAIGLAGLVPPFILLLVQMLPAIQRRH